ncbi:hypothetical protein BN3659_01730 [Alistipes sp. CHKCI003]|nr:hypothetical protein BN3659_01730 [Alistipes sp. CHKCI003]
MSVLYSGDICDSMTALHVKQTQTPAKDRCALSCKAEPECATVNSDRFTESKLTNFSGQTTLPTVSAYHSFRK